MASDTTCNLASLDPYIPTTTNPWNVSKINHLYRRIAFGATKAEVIDALNQNNPSALVDTLIDQAIALAPNAAPLWGFWDRDQFEAAEMANEDNDTGFYRREGKLQMINDLVENKVRDRLTLFWSNHFVTEDDEYRSPAYQYQYYNLLQLHALGNFRDFVYDIGISSPMLVYLNGDRNTNDRPNENYARELYELFTLGVDNGYDENDIIETAKALTGWTETNDIPWGPITFNPGRFSNDTKTIFGQSGNFGYDELIDDVLFAQRSQEIATFICSKLYAYFVSPTCSEAIVATMAQTFIANNFEIVPVLRQLFKSEHFFNQEAIGVIIKSPGDLLISLYNETGFTYPATFEYLDEIRANMSRLGQDVLNPFDVAGWQGDEDWISPDYLILRWDNATSLITMASNQNQDQFRNFILGLPIGAAVDGNLVGTMQSTDVEIVVKAILDYFFSRGITDPLIYEEALAAFKGDLPESYFMAGATAPNIWTLDSPLLNDQFLALLYYIVYVPEFQLK